MSYDEPLRGHTQTQNPTGQAHWSGEPWLCGPNCNGPHLDDTPQGQAEAQRVRDQHDHARPWADDPEHVEY